MEYTVKCGFNKYMVYDKNGSAVSTVRRERSPGNQLSVNDAAGLCRYRLVYRDGMTELRDGDGMYVACVHISDSSGDGRGVSEAYTRPPMAEKAEIETDHIRITVLQTRKRDFRIYLNEKEAGKMTHMMRFSKTLTFSEDFPPQYIGLVFAAGMLMLHADDVEIV